MVLYKVDSKGKLRVIKYSVEEDNLIQESGVDGGSLVVNKKVCIGKNIGKSNETSPNEQAYLELGSKVTEKLSEGYYYSPEEAYNSDTILPMLAKSYNDEKHKIDWDLPVLVQPKLDGMRCLGFIKDGKVTLQSRDGKLITTMKHIEAELALIEEDCILDGELYCHGLSFQENMKLIKKYRPMETEKISFVIYDTVRNEPYLERMYDTSLALVSGEFKHLSLISCQVIDNHEELTAYHSHALSEGYEGTIVRHGNQGYQKDVRSSFLLKYKDFQDTVALVVDIIPSEARPEQGVLVVKLLNGKLCKASLKMTHAHRAEILINKQDYIGQTAELRYFELTDEGLLRFPVCVGFRLDSLI